MAHIRVLISETHDPWFNLATEDYIFREMDPSQHILFLWRNVDTIVIGRYQNPWGECNLKAMEEDGVKLARRQSGGGAVYQDLGNTNFTFMSSRRSYDKSRNNRIITGAIGRFGIHAQPSGRNDILVEGRKISGSAFKLTQDRAFHHGTLLIRADLSRVPKYLTPDSKKLVSKGIKSVKSRVANLSEYNEKIDHENLSEAVIEEFFKTYGQRCEPEILDHETLKKIPHLNEYFEKLSDWNWRFGKTPDFSHHMVERFDWGRMELFINTNRGEITEVRIYSDTLMPELVEHLMEDLKNIPYEGGAIQTQIRRTADTLPEARGYLREFSDWLVSKI
ncbi:MAG: lipoate--protein ligase [Spirochaetaceae bacterium]